MRGEIDYSVSGLGEMTMVMVGTDIRCSGVYDFVSGNAGIFNGSCEDGTNFSGRFRRDGSLRFAAEGMDSSGRRFDGSFAFRK